MQPTNSRRPKPYRAPSRRPRRGQRQRQSFWQRSGIIACLILLAIYAAMQFFAPHWFENPVDTPAYRESSTPQQLTGSGKDLYIFDGDTIALHGQRIRFKGMDTPETQQQCQLQDKIYRCGDTATKALRQLIGSQTVICTSDGRDRYNRILAFCKAGEIDLNRMLVEQGWAVSYGLYQREEAQARKNKRGMWAGTFERPSKWRQNNKNAR